MVLAVLVLFLGMFYWANEIYIYLAEPLTRHLPEGANMIAIDVASPFLTPFKMVLMLAVFLAMPVILYQFWAFVAPGLYSSEKRIALPLLVSSILLFYAGVAFAYFIDRARRLLTSPNALRRTNIVAGLLLIAVAGIIPFA